MFPLHLPAVALSLPPQCSLSAATSLRSGLITASIVIRTSAFTTILTITTWSRRLRYLRPPERAFLASVPLLTNVFSSGILPIPGRLTTQRLTSSALTTIAKGSERSSIRCSRRQCRIPVRPLPVGCCRLFPRVCLALRRHAGQHTWYSSESRFTTRGASVYSGEWRVQYREQRRRRTAPGGKLVSVERQHQQSCWHSLAQVWRRRAPAAV